MDKMENASATTTTPLLANSGKRGPTCSLSGSSSSEGEGSDHEEIPPSPCSSTSSGPTYVRPPGFKHHGQEIKVQEPKPKVNVRIKRKIKRQSMMKDVLPLSHVTPHPVAKVTVEEKTGVQVLPPSGMKTKVRKDPIPMRLRALPQSFWQQPNTVNSASPGSMYSVLPPLCKMEQSNSDLADIRPVTPPSDGENVESRDAEPQETKSKDRKDAVCSEKDSLSLKLDLKQLEKDKERDPSRDREISPRDRDYSPRDKDVSPRDRDTGREKESPRDKMREALLEASKQLPPEAKKKQPRPPPRIVRVSPANTELLAKLFEGFDGEGKKKMVRRGRPKREYNPQTAALAAHLASTNTSNNNNNTTTPTTSNTATTSTASNPSTERHHPYLTGDDPYMIDNVAEGLLPMLSLETSRQTSGPSSQLAIVSIRGDNNRMLSLPSLSVEQNHSAILSELVKAL